MVDSLFISAFQIGGGILGGTVAGMMVDPDSPQLILERAVSTGLALGTIFWISVAFFLNYGILQGLTGATVGKMVCKLKVVGVDGQPIGISKSLARTFCYFFSTAPAGAGLFAIYFDKDVQCWHDKLCKTVVIRKGAQYPPAHETRQDPSMPRAA